MAKGWASTLARWSAAGLIDADTAERIRAFEREHDQSLAVAFGTLALGAGVLLFVAANWDTLSPAARFSLVVTTVALFHVAGAWLADRSTALACGLHTAGTIALGGGIFLSGQIFNLAEHWPGGVMVWAAGAAMAWALLRHWTQMAATAILVPAWLGSEWVVAFDHALKWRVLSSGLLLAALAYFTATRDDRPGLHRRTLLWIGGLALGPAALSLAASLRPAFAATSADPWLAVVGWTVALGAPTLVAVAARGRAAWPNVVAVAWVLTLFFVAGLNDVAAYPWWAVGAGTLIAWGVAESRPERVNAGSAIVAATIVAFYFSQVMDKLGRSASLIGLGLLFLGGGWALERGRRRLIERMAGGRA